MFENPRAILIKVGRRMSKLSGKEKLATKDGEDGRTRGALGKRAAGRTKQYADKET